MVPISVADVKEPEPIVIEKPATQLADSTTDTRTVQVHRVALIAYRLY